MIDVIYVHLIEREKRYFQKFAVITLLLLIHVTHIYQRHTEEPIL